MVSKKITSIIVLLIITSSCSNAQKIIKSDDSIDNRSDFIQIDDNNFKNESYCSFQIIKKMNSIFKIDQVSYNAYAYKKNDIGSYVINETKGVSTNSFNSDLDLYISGSENLKLYKIINNDFQYILLIGQAVGRSGIGADYWNYFVIKIEKKINYIEFTSLINNPFSLVLSKKQDFSYLSVEDTIERPAFKLDNEKSPYLVLSLFDFNGNKKKEANFKCNN